MTPDPQRLPFRTQLPQPSYEYKTAFGKWLSRGESVAGHGGPEVTTHPWWKVIWLTPEEDVRPLIFLMSD